MLRNEDSLLTLVGAIHAAAADPDPTGWPQALERLGDALGGAGAIITDHVLPETIADIACVRVAPEVPDYIMGRLQGPANPLVGGLPVLPPRVIMSPNQIIGESALRRMAIYATLQRVGLHHLLAAVLDRSDGRAVALSVGRDAARGPFTAEETDLLDRVLPHLAAAALVRRRLAGLLAVAEAPRRAVDLLARAVILVDAAGRVAYANPAAGRLLARRDGLDLDRVGALVGARSEGTARLRRLIAAAAAGGAGRGLAAGGALALPRPSGRPYVAQVLPLAPGADLDGAAHPASRPAAVIVVSDPEADRPPPQAQLRQAYGLTAAEAALAARLAAGASLKEAATALGVTANTAKTQLKTVFAKLGVDRQAALVRRLLADLGGWEPTATAASSPVSPDGPARRPTP